MDSYRVVSGSKVPILRVMLQSSSIHSIAKQLQYTLAMSYCYDELSFPLSAMSQQGFRAANGRVNSMQRSAPTFSHMRTSSRSGADDDDDNASVSSQGHIFPRGSHSSGGGDDWDANQVRLASRGSSRSNRSLPSRQRNASVKKMMPSPPGAGDDWDANQVQQSSRSFSRSSRSLPSRQRSASVHKLVPINGGVVDPDEMQYQSQEKPEKRSPGLQALLSPRVPANNMSSPTEFIANQWRKLKAKPRKQPSVLVRGTLFASLHR